MKKTFNINYYERIRHNHVNPLIQSIRKYILFPKDNAVTSSLINGWIYEPYMFRFISDNMIDLENTEIIDIGANNGHFSIEFAHYVGDKGKVYSFEPQRIIYQQLCGNIFLNGLDNVYAYNVALGDENKMTNIESVDYFKEGEINLGDIHISDDGETVEMKRLDNYEFKNLSVIKIDVQGYEPFVIDGAKETLKKHRPFIFIEIEDDQLKKFNSSESELIEKLEEQGYVVKQFQIGIPYQTVSGKCLDYVCIPIEKNVLEHYKII